MNLFTIIGPWKEWQIQIKSLFCMISSVGFEKDNCKDLSSEKKLSLLLALGQSQKNLVFFYVCEPIYVTQTCRVMSINSSTYMPIALSIEKYWICATSLIDGHAHFCIEHFCTILVILVLFPITCTILFWHRMKILFADSRND